MIDLSCKVCGEIVRRVVGYVPHDTRLVFCKKCRHYYSEDAMIIVTANGVDEIPSTIKNLHEGNYDEIEGLHIVGGANLKTPDDE